MCLLYILYIYSKLARKSVRCSGLNIIISNSSGKPIYEQICEQIKTMILKSELKEGDALPSMRLLAKELRISVITTKRAYEELEREGFVVSMPAKGCFVAPKNADLIREEHLKKIEEMFGECIRLANLSGVSQTELLEMLQMQFEGE